MVPDHNKNRIDNDACFRKSCRLVLNPGSDHNDGEPYSKRDQCPKNDARNNVDV